MRNSSLFQWHLNSWMNKPQDHQIFYTDDDTLNNTLHLLSSLPPLVTPFEIEKIKHHLGKAALGKQFLLQGGDCAESFTDCNAKTISNKLKILLQMSLILLQGLKKPVIVVGRMAGQYAKPRSVEYETQDNLTLLSYRGDLINRAAFTLFSRMPNPHLMIEGYRFSALTLNHIRTLLGNGFTNLLHPEHWQMEFIDHSLLLRKYQAIVKTLSRLPNFLKNIPGFSTAQDKINFYTSHEALHLLYEQALTRKTKQGRWYNLSAHFPWIGMRTSSLSGAHIEYVRGIANPIGVKIGPNMEPTWVQGLVNTLNPFNEPGRLTLIHRFGAKHIKQLLPPLIKAVKATGKIVLWSCDPMHGNTQKTSEGIKTRCFNDVLQELQLAFSIHHKMESYLGGVHFELTGENVTECIGGPRGISESNLKERYESLCDPRLNYEQSLDMAMLIVQAYGKKY